MKNILSNINWRRDLGVHLDMLNSKMPNGRNEFYWEILKEAQGRRCLEIGFGTGILSIIAIQHGALHIEAWEKNLYRYQLGCHIIKELRLQDQITLHYGEYNKSMYCDPSLLVIHEIIGSNIWSEGMHSVLPVGLNNILPGQYSMQFDVVAIDRDRFDRDFYPKRDFCPTIPIEPNFFNLVQSLIDQSPEVINQRDYYTEPVVEQLKFYQLDANSIDSFPASISKTYTADYYSKDQVLLFYPFATVAHNQHVLPWSWSDPIIITEHLCNITITQCLVTGAFYVGENL
jgi:hypothetical protein